MAFFAEGSLIIMSDRFHSAFPEKTVVDSNVIRHQRLMFFITVLMFILFLKGGISSYLGINPKLLYGPAIIICYIISGGGVFDSNAYCIIGYLGFVLMSFLFNSVPLDDFIFYFPRYYLDYLLAFFFCGIMKKNKFSYEDGVRLVRLLIFLWVLQVVMSAVYIWGVDQRIEGVCGLMSNSGGGLATLVSCCMFSFFMVYGFAKDNKWLFIAFSMPLLGYASQKRGIFYLVPLCALITIMLIFFCRDKFFSNRKLLIERFMTKLSLFIILLGILVPAMIYAIQTTRFSAAFDNWGEVSSDNVFEFLSSALEQNQRAAESGGLSSDRINTAITILQIVSSKLESFCFGINPLHAVVFVENDALGNANLNQYGIDYGLSGVSVDLFSGGFIGAGLILVMFVSSVVRLLKVDVSGWAEEWRWFPVGVAALGISGIINYILYSPHFFSSLAVFLCYMTFWYLATQTPPVFVRPEKRNDEQ